MRRGNYALRLGALLCLALFVAACGTTRGPTRSTAPSSTGEVKVGSPYQVAGQWYYPEHDPHYDEVGMASWYGPKFHGRKTANGETFNMNKLSAAHRTLPMPSHVKVTNMSNGRSIILRVNDRGPFANGRILDVSRRAAQLLGFERKGLERVRVQAVQSDGTPYPVPQRQLVASNPSDAQPPRGALSAPAGFLLVQVGAFSTRQATERAVARLNGVGPVIVQTVRVGRDDLYRVRLGPYTDKSRAESAYREAIRRGFPDTQIMAEPGS